MMAHSSLQVCMDSSDWLQGGTMSEDLSTGLDSSSPPSGGTPTTDCMLAAACSSRAGPPLMERRLRPPHDQHLKCPRCDSTHTKFCYYNNYSLSQPRYFCKTCRRYWTKGGTLRNIPVGGGCRKNNKKSTSKKSNDDHQQQSPLNVVVQGGGGLIGSNLSHNSAIDHLHHLSFPHGEVQFPPHLAHLINAQMSLAGGGGGGGGGGFMESGGGLIRPIDFMECKYEGLVGGGGGNRGHDFMGGNHSNNNNSTTNGSEQFGLMGGIGGYNGNFNSPFGVFNTTNDIHHHDGSLGISFMDQRMLLPYDGNNNHHHHHHHHQNGMDDVKPNPKLLSLEWQDHGCGGGTTTTTTTTTNTSSDHNGGGKDSPYGYHMNGGGATLGSWTGLMGGGFQSPTTNSLV